MTGRVRRRNSRWRLAKFSPLSSGRGSTLAAALRAPAIRRLAVSGRTNGIRGIRRGRECGRSSSSKGASSEMAASRPRPSRATSKPSRNSACGTLRGNPSSTQPLCWRGSHGRASGTSGRRAGNAPRARIGRASFPTSESASTCSRSNAPVLRWPNPRLSASLRPWVPLPDAGGPSRTSRSGLAEEPVNGRTYL